MKKHLVLIGHVAVDPCQVVLTVKADLEPEPRTMTPGSVRIVVKGGESVELYGEEAAAWWRYVDVHARPLSPRILTSHGHDVEPRGDLAEEC